MVRRSKPEQNNIYVSRTAMYTAGYLLAFISSICEANFHFLLRSIFVKAIILTKENKSI